MSENSLRLRLSVSSSRFTRYSPPNPFQVVQIAPKQAILIFCLNHGSFLQKSLIIAFSQALWELCWVVSALFSCNCNPERLLCSVAEWKKQKIGLRHIVIWDHFHELISPSKTRSNSWIQENRQTKTKRFGSIWLPPSTYVIWTNQINITREKVLEKVSNLFLYLILIVSWRRKRSKWPWVEIFTME